MSNGIDIAALATQAAQEVDYTVVSSGSFEKVLPVEGKALCRFREYIELGLCETKSQTYPNKKPAQKVRFVFELVTPKHQQVFKEGEADEFKRPHVISIEVAISTSEKSNFIKLFKKLNFNQTATHPAQLLGTGYLCEVVHAWKKGEDTKKEKPSYANLQLDGTYTFTAPRIEDPMEGTVTDIPVPDMAGGRESMRIFLYGNPTKECWDTLYIEGTYEKDGKDLSKNWLQERIMSALDYAGSKLEEMILSGDGTGLGDLPTDEPVAKDALSDMGL